MLLAVPAAAGTLTGVVRNGTTGKPAAGADVVLLELQGGMDTVANTKTDAQGRYSLTHEQIGQRPVLVRVVYRGVNYHQNVPPGQLSADVEVFEPTAGVRDLRVTSRVLVVQPNGPELLVGEEYTIQNVSQPPAAYSKEFEFRTPPGAEVAQISAWGPAGMPTVQGKITKGRDHYAVAFPLRPGKNGVRISYQLPYSTSQAAVGAPAFYPAERVMLIAPPTMQVSGTGFTPAGMEQGWNIYARDALPAGTPLEVAVSGTAPAPSDSAAAGQGTAQQGATGANVTTLPSRLHNLTWPLIAGFVALFAMGLFLLLRKPAPQAAGAAAQAQAQVEGEVRQGLDGIKDTLFRLELRRQAGTITEEEYARERARAEKVLRDLVGG
jgi:hypothetical protein